MDAAELVRQLGKRVNVELSLDQDDACAFEADGLAVTINYMPEIGALVLSGDVGEPPPERLEGLYKVLLAANHLFSGSGGATLSLDDATGRISLCRALPVAIADADSFYSDVEKFVNTAEAWRKIVTDYRDAASVPAAQSDADGESGGFMKGSGFMQV